MSWLERAAAQADRRRVPSLEHLYTSPDYFGVVGATPLQRAICRIADGAPLGELAEHPHIQLAVGDVSGLPVGQPPRMLVLVAAIRGGKSVLAAAAGYRQAQICQVDGFTAGEVPRVPIVSVHKDIAKPTLDHLVGAVTSRPRMRERLASEPTADTVTLRHPSGRLVEIRVVAGARAGATLAARWLTAAIFDEAPRMVGGADGVVNLDDMLSTIEGRMLGPIMLLGSPWAPFGPVYDLVQEHHGHPSAACVVIRARGDMLNPGYWTAARVAGLSPLVRRTDYEADFADPAEALIPAVTVDRCMAGRDGQNLPRQPGHAYTAAIDPATRSNAFTLVVGTREGQRIAIVHRQQWKPEPGAPLDPDRVLGEIQPILARYGCRCVDSDGWSGDALAALARRHGLELVPYADGAADVSAMYLELARRMSLGEIQLPVDPDLRTDLVRAQKFLTATGVRIHLPTTRDGRHCDYVPALARIVRAYLADVAPHVLEGDAEQARVLASLQTRWKRRRDVPVWKRGYG